MFEHLGKSRVSLVFNYSSSCTDIPTLISIVLTPSFFNFTFKPQKPQDFRIKSNANQYSFTKNVKQVERITKIPFSTK